MNSGRLLAAQANAPVLECCGKKFWLWSGAINHLRSHQVKASRRA